MGREGCADRIGACLGSCSHVWNYEQATVFLYGDLAKTKSDVEFNYAIQNDGGMPFRTALPPINDQTGKTFADGKMGTIMKMYRESMDNHFNNMRSYAFGDESALLMASWTSVITLSGFQYSAIDKSMSFISRPGTYFWSNGSAWGTCEILKNSNILTVKKGIINIGEVML